MNGIGRVIYEYGHWYLGDHKNNKKDGIGIHYWKDGQKYTG
jgi:hypothetical protein